MADQADNPAVEEREGGAPAGWRAVWQAPTLLLAVALLVTGVAAAVATRPDPDLGGMLDRAEALVERERYTEAIEVLNERFYPYYDRPVTRDGHRRRYHLALGRSIYHGQAMLGVRLDANFASALSELLEAERRETTLTPADVGMVADCLIELGQIDRALERAWSLGEESRDLRYRILKKIVDREMARPSPDFAMALQQIARLKAEAELPRAERIWAAGRQADILLRQGYAQEVVDRVLRAMPRLAGGDERDLLGLFVRLGEAYTEMRLLDEAAKHLTRASALADGTGDWWGRIQYLMGRIDNEEGRLTEARDRHLDIVKNHGQSVDLLANLLALGETEAGLGRTDESMEAYLRLADELSRGESHTLVTRERVTASLMERFTERFTAGDPEGSRRFATVAERLWGFDHAPREVLLALAQANERMADLMMPATPEGSPRLTDESLAPATRELIKPLLIASGAYYRAHAERVVTIDNEAYAESLWASARAFDRAGQQEEAIGAYRAYADGFPDSARRAEARFRLARAFHARGRTQDAEAIYRDLIEKGLDRSGDKGAGVWADQSYVPLAQTLLLDTDDSNDAEAERLLTAVVEGDLGTPDAAQYPTALLELGRLHYRRGDYPRAIERLEEMRGRYPDHPDAGMALFWLADAFRLEAQSIAETLMGALPDSQRERLEAAQIERTERAGALFGEVIRILGAEDPRRRTTLENLYLRNAHFYRGDCAFDLGDFATAIRHYDAARLAYRDDPASLVAMVQIVNAHVAEGDYERARAANERARLFFEQLPDQVWDDPTLPMTRADWERWLDSSSRLYALDRAG